MDTLENKLAEIKNPLVVFCFGILTGLTFYFKNVNIYYLFALCLIVFLFLIVMKKKSFLFLLMALLFSYFYPFIYFKYFVVDLNNLLGKKNIYIGEIVSLIDTENDYSNKYILRMEDVPEDLTFKKSKLKFKSNVLVVGSYYEEYEAGDLVQLTGKIQKPKKALLPGLFDESRYLLTKGVFYVLKADHGSLVFLDSKQTLLKRKVIELRKTLTSMNNLLPKRNLALVNGITFGDKASRLPKSLREKIQELGLSHITSASGFNVSVLTFGIFFLCRLFLKNKIIPILISIFAVIFYSAIADFSPSVLRASIFIIMVLTGNLFNKKLKVLPGISFIFLLFFLTSPVNVLDIGFQLSILAFLGIVLFTDPFTNIIYVASKKIQGFINLIFVQSLIAQIMVIPLIVFYFHNVQLLGLVSNIVAIPLASLVLIVNLISILFSLFPFLNFVNVFLGYLLFLFSDLFILWIRFLYKFPLKEAYLPNLNFYFLILLYIFIFSFILFLFLPALRKRLSFVFIGLLLVFSFLFTFTSKFNYLTIFCLPVYNQEAMLVLPPGEKPIFIGTVLNERFKGYISNFLKLNCKPSSFEFINLTQDCNSFLSSSYITCKKNKLTIKYKDFSFEILKTNSGKITSAASCLKLARLMKNEPYLKDVLVTYPQTLIVNDFKRLSKKSTSDILWLKTLNVKSFFLSKSGTIALLSNGKSFKIESEI